MDKDENIIDEVITDLIEGNISIQRTNGVRRSCNITFENIDGSFTPSINGNVFIAKKFKLYSGLIIDDEEVFPPESVQGVFNIGNPIVKSEGSLNTVTIEGYDNFALLNGTISGQIEPSILTIDKGTSIREALISILDFADIIQSPIVYDTTEVIPYTMNKEAGSTYEEFLLELAGFLS
jgi:hypothetical protein